MATDLRLKLEDRPGSAAELAEALGNAGINMLGFCGVVSGGEGVVQLCVDDREGAHRAREDAGIQVEEAQQVIVVNIEDRPGSLGEMARKIAAAGVNLTVAYVGTNNRMILGAMDLEGLRAAVS